ncbi:hypothetical protein EJ110_NYTH18597 [Nymphaea thermarum]|nr:hypothetical protein EJ110_NYTH18597 [Nymphaea thermarum]
MAAMALVATAYPYKPSGFVPVPHVEKDGHVQYLGEFAVKRYNEKKHAYLKFIQVTEAQVLDRGTEHYTYKLVIKVQNGYAITFYKSEILQDLSAPGKPPVLNVAYFTPLAIMNLHQQMVCVMLGAMIKYFCLRHLNELEVSMCLLIVPFHCKFTEVLNMLIRLCMRDRNPGRMFNLIMSIMMFMIRIFMMFKIRITGGYQRHCCHDCHRKHRKEASHGCYCI